MTQKDETKQQLEALSRLYIFDELYRFMRESTGIAMAIAYVMLLLSSMAYLHMLFSAFDISVVKYVTFEDVLATPIKNPDIILIFIMIVLVMYLTDMGNRFRARIELRYADQPMPRRYKILHRILWAPRRKKANIQLTVFTVIICLAAYIVAFADIEANEIKEGKGAHVEITLVDGSETISTTLLGTSVNYVFTYDHTSHESVIYYIESIKSMKNVRVEDPVVETPTKSAPVKTPKDS